MNQMNFTDILQQSLRGIRRSPGTDDLEVLTENILLVKHVDGVDYVTINRPERLNALDPEAVRVLNNYFEDLQIQGHKTRIVVLTGSGERGFCAGLDLKAASVAKSDVTDTGGDMLLGTVNVQKGWSNIVRKMRSVQQPIIGCINGLAYGGGFGLALACDIRLATKQAKFAVQNIKIGLSGGDVGISYFLPRCVGMTIAAELMYTGRVMNSERALRCNLVSEVYDTVADMSKAAETLAKEMIRTSPMGLRMTKDCLTASIDAPNLETSLMVEDRQQVLLAMGGPFSKVLSAKSRSKNGSSSKKSTASPAKL